MTQGVAAEPTAAPAGALRGARPLPHLVGFPASEGPVQWISLTLWW